MTIDEVAKHFRISKSKLRYYEKNGVIKEITIRMVTGSIQVMTWFG